MSVALRGLRARLTRPAVVLLAVAGALLALGIAPGSALVAGLGAAALTAVVERIDLRPEPAPERHRADRRDGARGEVLDLAWTMVGRDGRAGERVLRELRSVAAGRLARHGVDLADPDAAADVDRLLGARARATLTRTTHPLPTPADVAHTVTALERLGPHPSPDLAPPPAAGRPAPDPHPRRTDA
ncbi:hypothetical protein [Cellulomonas shaoxiangyii]|uniref:Uncharacterized protein n=1 Tax=Cellulomonas shaoxiangyii TaxID=2566013 RepID=A0A4P7SMC3_9CELL|nr:hypothetical protein [Cellulomonas shaoxiangyii]QCB94918.1 hypothetical protein E5225_16450 [Cellulomonas shaoxiangyii]TGY77179.1 hypothetical protein E5226_17260 [Cellulomonas shaoxiangyii]